MDNATSEKQIITYLDALKNLRHLAPLTISHYRWDLAELLAMAATLVPGPTLTDLTQQQVRRFASQLHARGLDPRSIARKLSAWRGFFSWLAEQDVVRVNPVDGVKAPRRGTPLPKALSTDDAVRLVSADTTLNIEQAVQRSCDHAMFELLYSSGLRVSELAGLDVRHTRNVDYQSVGWIDLAGAEVVVTGKGNKMRSVPVGRAALLAIESWLAIRPSVSNADPDALFLNTRGARISVRLIQLRLKAHATRVGIPVNVHPHVLRHSFASHVLQSSGDLRAVQEMLGHASITSTQIYTALDFQRLAQVYDAAHPRARKKS
ncbi:tyrosine recombinase XerC [Actimicrobium sp. CCC2.4]|uniref:tyrosine recombinase XerC n=1 Tax=Actimicrobium sp. CCC2.4 TaxID=3048606 RepID=UPI002AC9A9A4|nr:tyrosine recombinase XerC [Actimicrobium sp. CCC2.4]MEB0134211.1 tyrosine recombinase XerC [Actimicrobium sp. CCC2.4]WPX32862.1 tyrosine recombinase XerC [Actimicrobium sp. CCC2.4]